jgi:hypothetical protein
MSDLQAAMIRSIQGFATELTRARLYDCGHADAWELVERTGTTEDLTVRARHCAGYAACSLVGNMAAGSAASPEISSDRSLRYTLNDLASATGLGRIARRRKL